jgi:hypothetical protein
MDQILIHCPGFVGETVPLELACVAAFFVVEQPLPVFIRPAPCAEETIGLLGPHPAKDAQTANV